MTQKTLVESLERWTREEVAILGNTGYPSLRRFAGFVRRTLPPPLALRARIVATDLLAPAMRRRARRLARRPPLLLQLGSGRFPTEGWVNVDLVGAPVELAWNLMRPLPFADGSADAVYHEHVLEHLSPGEGLALLRECHRVLRPGGVLRVAVPDAGAYAHSYAGEGDMLDRVRPARPTRMLALQEVFYWSGHRTAFDAETLGYFFRAAGFAEPETRSFADSSISPPPDHEHRRAESLYVESVKR